MWTGAENLAHTGIRSPDHPSPCESLNRLRYPGPQIISVRFFFLAYLHVDWATRYEVSCFDSREQHQIFLFSRYSILTLGAKPASCPVGTGAHFPGFNPLTPNDDCSGRTAPLTSKRCIFYIYSTNISTEYFKHGIYSPFFPLQNAVCFINLTYLVPVLFTFYKQVVLKLKKKNNSGAKRLSDRSVKLIPYFNLVPKFKMRGDVHPLPHVTS